MQRLIVKRHHGRVRWIRRWKRHTPRSHTTPYARVSTKLSRRRDLENALYANTLAVGKAAHRRMAAVERLARMFVATEIRRRNSILARALSTLFGVLHTDKGKASMRRAAILSTR
jgi:hypothetical protein